MKLTYPYPFPCLQAAHAVENAIRPHGFALSSGRDLLLNRMLNFSHHSTIFRL
jgi:hypothetical protein